MKRSEKMHSHSHSSRSAPLQYSRNQIVIGGYSGAGKTTLIEALIGKLSSEYRVGFVKRDAHRFMMDKEGKDTDRAAKAGARAVLVNDPHHFAVISQGTIGAATAKTVFAETDIVFVEGTKHSDQPKFILLDPRDEIEADRGTLRNVVAYVGPDATTPDIVARLDTPESRAATVPVDGPVPYFQRDDTDAISAYLLDYFRRTIPPLYGLVLAGGESVRMGTSKARLAYHGLPQASFAAATLDSLCEETFVSLSGRQEESSFPLPTGVRTIADRFAGFGPAGGILTALHEEIGVAWLVLGCDLPLMSESDLAYLIGARTGIHHATAFTSPFDGLPEPMAAIYEPEMKNQFHQLFAEGVSCPRKALIRSNANSVSPPRSDALLNANTPSDREQVESILSERVGA